MASKRNDGEDEVEWENQLYWFPSAKNREVYQRPDISNYQHCEVVQHGHERKFNDFRQDIVRSIKIFNTPLELPWGKEKGDFFVHSYNVVETTSENFFCFSKGKSHIEILCADDIQDIHDSQHQGELADRDFNVFSESNISHKKYTIQDIVEWIFNSGEITRGYNLLFDNCGNFASRLLRQFSYPY